MKGKRKDKYVILTYQKVNISNLSS